MTVIPGQQNVSTFLGGGYNQPQPLQAQIPGGQQLPQMTPPSLEQATQPNQAQNMQSPTGANFNSLLLQHLAGANMNSGINHSPSSGGITPTYQSNFQPQQSQLMTGVFGNRLAGGY